MIKIRDAWAEAWKEKPKIPITEWAPERYRLSPQYEATPGAYQLATYPYMVAILEAFADPEVEVLTIVASTQVGKTLFVLMALSYVAETDPAPALVCCPDQSSAIELRDRFYGNALESPGLRNRVPPERRWNTRHIDLRSSRIYLAWAGSRQRLRGRPCRYVVLSEVDVYRRTIAGDPVRVAAERTKKFYRSKIVHESTPVGEDSAITAEYEAGDQNRLYGQCPECHRWQELRFFTYKTGSLEGKGGITGCRGEDGELVSDEAARRNARYVCINGCEIGDDRKRDLVGNCRWVKAGEDIDPDGNLTGTAKRGKRHTSFRLWSIFSNTVSFADIASAYIEHVNSGALAEFFENWLGLKFSTQKKIPRWQLVGQKLADSSYTRGTVPRHAWFITAGADVQEDGVYWSARAWGRSGASWLIDWGFLPRYTDQETPGNTTSDLDQLTEHVVKRQWPVVDDGVSPMGKSDMGALLVCVDANWRTADVRRWMRSVRSNRVRAIIGDTRTVKTAERFRRTRIDKTSDKKSPTRGMVVWRVNVNVYKEQTMDAILAACGGATKLFVLPGDIMRRGVQYLKQLVNESKRKVVNAHGRSSIEWVVRSASIGNHQWDTEVYSRAAADMKLEEMELNWDSDEWPTPSPRDDGEPVSVLDRTRRD